MLRKQLENDVSNVENRKHEIINNAKNEARNILISAKEEANDIIKELNSLYNTANKDSLKKANSLRDNLNLNIKNNLVNDINTNTNSSQNNDSTTFEISIGMQVLVKPFNMTGTILTIPNRNNEVMVQFGSTKTKVKVANLELIKNSNSQENFKNNSAKGYTTSSNLKAKSVSTEINVIGENVEDAIFIIDKFLDDCYLANLPNVRIVHGKGTGKLREGIHTFLRKHPHVLSFRLGTFGEGEMGVTIVEFKK